MALRLSCSGWGSFLELTFISDEIAKPKTDTALIAAIAAVLVWVGFFTRPGFFESVDWILFYEPNFQFLMDSVRRGEIPWWNPYIGLGRPFVGDLQNAVFYPPVYLLLLGKKIGAFLLIWAHAVLAIKGVEMMGRRFGAGFWHGVVLGCCLLLSAQFSGRLLAGQLMYWCAACYIPFLLALTHDLRAEWSWRRVAMLAIVFAGQLLCGHPQIFWISTIGVGLFVMGLLLHQKESWRLKWKSGGQVIVGLAWACLLAAVVLVPFAELVGQGNRSEATLEFAGYHALAWKDLRGFIFPPVTDWERNSYIGFILTALTLLALLKAKVRWPLILLLAFSLLFGLGNNTPFFKLFYYGLPGTSSFRIPSRVAILFLVAAVLAALLVSSAARRKNILLVLLVFAGIEAAFETHRLKFLYNYGAVRQKDPSFPVYTNAVRILKAKGWLEEGMPPPRVHVNRDLLPSNFAMHEKFSSTDAYTSLFLKRPWQYLHEQAGVEPARLQNTFLNKEVYRTPFPYKEMAQEVGFSREMGGLLLLSNRSERAFFLGGTGPVKIIRFQPSVIDVEFTALKPEILVFREAYYPGWKLRFGDEWVENVPVNGWMRAFPVPAGNYRAEARYRPHFFSIGVAASFVGWVALFFVVRRSRDPASTRV